ncbi:hypothetical protein F383_12230 [Gossypium arboreum]|uniref:adenylate kinase n=1 Tax=Gossypium arboreum TaxID=29729 RepID=A0A0B0NAZ8_GOSAR|nr:hypothetical protein F383_12230 [Gossypium arboreum]
MLATSSSSSSSTAISLHPLANYNASATPSLNPSSLSFSSSYSYLSPLSFRLHSSKTHLRITPKKGLRVSCSTNEPLKVMISGAPASGKGTQCELIVQKFGLVHISTGDLLRAEVSSGTEIGNKAKEFMNSGRLVPDEIVTAMVTVRLSRQDAKEKGWLLDGYPRSFAQAQSLEELNIRPDIYIVLDLPNPTQWKVSWDTDHHRTPDNNLGTENLGEKRLKEKSNGSMLDTYLSPTFTHTSKQHSLPLYYLKIFDSHSDILEPPSTQTHTSICCYFAIK